MLDFYRIMPFFKGKSKLGKLLFKSCIKKNNPVEFSAHQNIVYKIPNTLESIGIELFLTGIYERKVIHFLRSHVKSGDYYFDIGANIGAVGLPIVKNIPFVNYIGFEASPEVFEYLKYNFKNNMVDNYELHNYVVHEHGNGSMKFYQTEKHGMGSLAPTFTQQFILVDSISLGAFCNTRQITIINWLKIDVQGFELYVLKGLRKLLLDKKVENILFEYEPWEEKSAGLDTGSTQKYLLNLGYELFNISGEKLIDIKPKKRVMIWAKAASS